MLCRSGHLIFQSEVQSAVNLACLCAWVSWQPAWLRRHPPTCPQALGTRTAWWPAQSTHPKHRHDSEIRVWCRLAGRTGNWNERDSFNQKRDGKGLMDFVHQLHCSKRAVILPQWQSSEDWLTRQNNVLISWLAPRISDWKNFVAIKKIPISETSPLRTCLISRII